MSKQPKRVTAADVASELGISRATVGYVLNDTPGQTISEATKRRVLAKAQSLGYQPNRAAQALASGSSRIVLLILPDWPLDHSMRAHLDETSLALEDAGYSLVTFTEHAGSNHACCHNQHAGCDHACSQQHPADAFVQPGDV